MADAGGVEDVERHLTRSELHVELALALDFETEEIGIEGPRARDVPCQERDKINPLNLHLHTPEGNPLGRHSRALAHASGDQPVVHIITRA